MNQPTYQPYHPSGLTAAQIAAETAAFMRKVYAFMATGLLATGLTALLVASSETAIQLILGNRIIFYGLLFGELAMVWGFSAMALACAEICRRPMRSAFRSVATTSPPPRS